MLVPRSVLFMIGPFLCQNQRTRCFWMTMPKYWSNLVDCSWGYSGRYMAVNHLQESLDPFTACGFFKYCYIFHLVDMHAKFIQTVVSLGCLKHVATGIFRRMNQSTFKFRKNMFFWICFMVIRVCAFNMLNHQSTFGVQVLLDIWVQPTLRGEEPTAESCGRKGRKTPEQQLAWFQWTLCSGVALLVFDVKHDFDLPALNTFRCIESR